MRECETCRRPFPDDAGVSDSRFCLDVCRRRMLDSDSGRRPIVGKTFVCPGCEHQSYSTDPGRVLCVPPFPIRPSQTSPCEAAYGSRKTRERVAAMRARKAVAAPV